MKKDFDPWNIEKQRLNAHHQRIFYRSREIWWYSFGVNVGREQDGKGLHFERPVIVIRDFNADTFLGAAIIGRKKEGKYYFPLGIIGDREASVNLSQVRIFDVKRLRNKIMTLDEDAFQQLKSALQQALFGETSSPDDISTLEEESTIGQAEAVDSSILPD